MKNLLLLSTLAGLLFVAAPAGAVGTCVSDASTGVAACVEAATGERPAASADLCAYRGLESGGAYAACGSCSVVATDQNCALQDTAGTPSFCRVVGGVETCFPCYPDVYGGGCTPCLGGPVFAPLGGDCGHDLFYAVDTGGADEGPASAAIFIGCRTTTQPDGTIIRECGIWFGSAAAA